MIRPSDASHSSAAITNTGELIGALPLLLGFHPTNSLVLVTQSSSKPTLSGVIRVDLPAPQEIPGLVTQLRDVLVTGGVIVVTAIVVCGHFPGPDSVPQRIVVDALTVRLRAAAVTIRHWVWASATDSGARWGCSDPCQCGGSVPAMRTSALAAALTVAGATVADSREQLAATLAADPDDQLERRAAMLDALMHSTAAPASRPTAQVGYRMVRDAIVAAADHPSLPNLSDKQIVNLAKTLSDPEVRDQCLMAAGSDHAAAAERLWTVLTRATPAPERAQPAVLLAVHAYLRGDGVLATIALGIAQDADPEHILARLLDVVLQHGTPPADLRRLIQEMSPAPFDTGD